MGEARKSGGGDGEEEGELMRIRRSSSSGGRGKQEQDLGGFSSLACHCSSNNTVDRKAHRALYFYLWWQGEAGVNTQASPVFHRAWGMGMRDKWGIAGPAPISNGAS